MLLNGCGTTVIAIDIQFWINQIIIAGLSIRFVLSSESFWLIELDIEISVPSADFIVRPSSVAMVLSKRVSKSAMTPIPSRPTAACPIVVWPPVVTGYSRLDPKSVTMGTATIRTIAGAIAPVRSVGTG